MGTESEGEPGVRLRFFLPSAELCQYITTYYLMEVTPAGGQRLVDYLHPEWGNLRFGSNDDLHAAIGAAPLRPMPHCIAVGPTSVATQFSLSRGRIWGIGLLPLGWLKFIDAPAKQFADTITETFSDPAFGNFVPLAETLFAATPDIDAEVARINAHMLQLADKPLDDEDEVTRVHSALVDASVSTVAKLAELSGMSARTLERFSHKAFGFTPKLLLRRQRFLRSLSRFMLDPSLSWLSTLDYQYHDQAHFVRDFKRFMSMTPNQYRELPHPILMAAVRARAEAAGQTMQGLHDPGESG
ncbi:helix-turn-helix domain-containing protein [Pontixanthobacter aestiaquae]|uniref:Helix-turn-helix domain-containing protein n=1 Tax=Pontixanthobacter aestiaquae TaxID=1509367 RepID=A0A844YZR7_9SPHN|nr:helix-turn-helix domain-containing protein [Pontixanthobacter aestiaquae]MDN3647051.1 helix-turn-helix domain-containing protein [Pontixanthobacter aestiaquae]MXO81971.1 helix-turn-helix domain-containing protein [Pontixanthobacter aestiaquae]